MSLNKFFINKFYISKHLLRFLIHAKSIIDKKNIIISLLGFGEVRILSELHAYRWGHWAL